MRGRPGRLRWIASALAAALLAAVAFATTTHPVDATCPACDHEFTALELGSTNTFGGTDLDLCQHANGDAPNSYWVWVCPKCRYAEWEGSFADAIADDALKARLRAEPEVDHEIALDVSQRDIPGWVKYELLLQHREIEGAPVFARARVALLGGWCVRLESPDDLRPLWREDEIGAAWKALGEAAWERMRALPTIRDDSRDRPRREVEIGEAILRETAGGEITDDDVALRRLYGAWLVRYRGEIAVARPPLRQIAEGRPEGDRLRGVAEALLAGIDRETSFLERWVALGREALATADLDGETTAVATYQVGDVLRRLGRADAGADFIVQALEHDDLSAWLHVTACESMDRIDAERLPAERREQLWQRRFDRLIERLNDPDTAESAYHSLSVFADAKAIPGVVAALSHESDEVRAYAALTLKFLPDLPDSAIDELCRVLMEDLDDPEYRAAVTLASLGSPRAREAFLVGLDSGNRRVRELSAEGIAMTGEAEDVTRLLELVDVYPDQAGDVKDALTRLTCRDVKDLAEFRAWWAERGEETRAQWTRACFARAGIDLAALPDAERVPRLLDLLESDDAPLRCAALRLLRAETGRHFEWRELCFARDAETRAEGVAAWRAWWESR